MTDKEAEKDIGDRFADIDEKLENQVEIQWAEVKKELVKVEEELKEEESRFKLKEVNNDIRVISHRLTQDNLPEDQKNLLTSRLTHLNEMKEHLNEIKILLKERKEMEETFLMGRMKLKEKEKFLKEKEKKILLMEEKAVREKKKKKEREKRWEIITSFKDAKEFIEENNLHLRENPNPLTEEGLLCKTDLRHRDVSIATILKSAEAKLAFFERVDKESHPILTCLGAPGTGKSRLAEEAGKSFRYIGTRHDKENYPNLAKLENDVLCIHLSFNSSTKLSSEETDVQGALSRRLISSAFDLDWKLSERFRSMKFRDSLKLVLHFHRLHHASDAPRTLVYVASDDIEGVYDNFGKRGLRALTDAVGMSLIDPPAGMLFVSLLTGTVRAQVRDVLVGSHPWTGVGVPLLPLEESLKVVADAGVRRELVYNDHMLGRIIASTGGVPRVLEWLVDYLCNVGEDMVGLEEHLLHEYMNVYGANDNKDIKAKCIEMSILREPTLRASSQVLPDCSLSFSDLEKSGDIFLEPVDGSAGYLVVMPLIAIQACAANGVHIIPPNMLKVTANGDTWTNFEKLTAFYHALLCTTFSRCSAAKKGENEEALVDVTEFFRGALISEDLKAVKLVLLSRHYGVVQSERRFPETKHSYEGIMGSKEYKEGDVILNAKGAKTDILIASRMATSKGLWLWLGFEEVKTMLLLHCKHATGGTALSVEDVKHDWKRGLASIEAGKKDASCKDLGWKNAVQVTMSNRELSSDESKVVAKEKQCIVVSANQVREFYGPIFSPFVQLLRRHHWPQLPPQGRQFSTFSPACGRGRRAASTWPRLVQIIRRLK